MRPIYIATEDALSEAVADRLVADTNQGLAVTVRLGRKGNGYLKQVLPSLAQVARSLPVFMLTDLDRIKCPPMLIELWVGRHRLPDDFLLRVAVREVETWLLADREGFSNFSGVPLNKMPRSPEDLDDPKRELLQLVRRYGCREIKANMLPEPGSTVKIGLGYNEVLSQFVRDTWSVDNAASRSESLSRARHRLRDLSNQ